MSRAVDVEGVGLAPRWSSAYDEDYAVRFAAAFPDLDPGIRRAVQILRHAGISTYESCEGGEGHAVAEPSVWFGGAPYEGWQALAALLAYDLPVKTLAREWAFEYGDEPVGPTWRVTFRHKLEP